jgi:hypothetical protein
VSEDAFWDPRQCQPVVHDTEDKNGDGRLDRSSDLRSTRTPDRWIHSVRGAGYTGGSSDRTRNDYDFDPERVPQELQQDQQHGGKRTSASQRASGHGGPEPGWVADFFDAYYEATIDLADTSSYVATDVVRDYGPREQELEHPLSRINGWRRYRVPLSEEAFVRVCPSASLERVEHFASG